MRESVEVLDARAKKYYADHYNKLKGRRIVDWQFLDDNTIIEEFMWGEGDRYAAVVFILDDGTTFVPMRDPEGNGAGHLDVLTKADREE